MSAHQQVTEELCRKFSDNELAKIIGTTSTNIRLIRSRKGIPCFHPKVTDRGLNAKYTLDTSFFDLPLSRDAAYVLGLIIADGSIKEPGSISIALKAEDINLLQGVAYAMGSNAPIKTSNSSGYGGIFKRATLNIYSSKLLRALANWGVGPRKSLVVGFPFHVPPHLYRDVVRGVFDGDGHIGIYRKGRQFGFTGNGILIPDIANVIEEHVGIRKTPKHRVRGSSDYWELQYGSRDRDVLIWIFEGATLYLQRKYNIVVRFLSETSPGL